MRLFRYQRVARGWKTIILENIEPAEVRRLKDESAKLIASRQKPGGCGCYQSGKLCLTTCHFHAIRIGETICGSASGTLTELFAAGLEPAPLPRLVEDDGFLVRSIHGDGT